MKKNNCQHKVYATFLKEMTNVLCAGQSYFVMFFFYSLINFKHLNREKKISTKNKSCPHQWHDWYKGKPWPTLSMVIVLDPHLYANLILLHFGKIIIKMSEALRGIFPNIFNGPYWEILHWINMTVMLRSAIHTYIF